jgi:hypothetical protein
MLSLSITVPGDIWGESIPAVAGDVFARLRPTEPVSSARPSRAGVGWLLKSACSLDKTFASPEATSTRWAVGLGGVGAGRTRNNGVGG